MGGYLRYALCVWLERVLNFLLAALFLQLYLIFPSHKSSQRVCVSMCVNYCGARMDF